MTLPIKGLHHVTTLASDPRRIDRFWRQDLGLRRIKQTVNFDDPSVYHLYYGNQMAEPGSVMTHFPFPGLARGKPGIGEVRSVSLSVPVGSLEFWAGRLPGAESGHWFDADCVDFQTPDGDEFRLIERADDRRKAASGIGSEAIRGFAGVTLSLADIGAEAEILQMFGYQRDAVSGSATRYRQANSNGADVVDLVAAPDLPRAVQGAGSVHHIAFAVADRTAQDQVRTALLAAGHQVTGVKDRDYFHSIYFRTPGGVLFEVATDEPGFDVDEDMAHLGQELRLPKQHEHLRDVLQQELVGLD